MRECAMEIRPETAADVGAVGAVNRAAFETTTEADLVELLRAQAAPIVSLVAEDAGSIVGHILFSPATLLADPSVKVMGLAPMASRSAPRPGSVRAVSRPRCLQAVGFSAVIVLGHAEYYPRFGFQPASRFGISCEYDVPDDVFMALELQPGSLTGKSGTVRYHPAFATV